MNTYLPFEKTVGLHRRAGNYSISGDPIMTDLSPVTNSLDFDPQSASGRPNDGQPDSKMVATGCDASMPTARVLHSTNAEIEGLACESVDVVRQGERPRHNYVGFRWWFVADSGK